MPGPTAGPSSSSNDELEAFLAGTHGESDELASFLKTPDAHPPATPFSPDAIRPMASHAPTPPSEPPPAQSSATSRFLSGVVTPVTSAYQTANTLGKQGAEMIRQQGLAGVPDALSHVVRGSVESLVKGPAEAIGRGVAAGDPAAVATGATDAIIPVSDIAQRARSGDWAGAAGEAFSTAAMLAGPHLAKGRLRMLRPKGEAPAVEPESAIEPKETADARPNAPSEPEAQDRPASGDEQPAPESAQKPQPDAPAAAQDADAGPPTAAPVDELEQFLNPSTPDPALTARAGHVSDLSPKELREVRRIVHELDAMPFTPRLLQPRRYGGDLEHVEGTGGAGAAVYDDIAQAPSAGASQPSRGTLQKQLEAFLGGGKPTKSVQAAIEIARLRALGGPRRIPGDGNLSAPELPPNAGEVPTRLEAKPAAAGEDADTGRAEAETPTGDVDELGQWFADQAANEKAPEAPPPPAPADDTPLSVHEFAQALAKEGSKPLVEDPFSLTAQAGEPQTSQADLFQPEKPTFGQWLGQKSTAKKTPPIGFQSTLVPGAAELVEQDIAPRVREALGAARSIREALSPQTASLEAQRSADIIREANAQIANFDAIERSHMARVAKHFDRQSDDANIANIAAYERSGQFAAEPVEGYSQHYQKSMTLSGRLLEAAYGGNIVGRVENYVRRAFVFGSKADEAAGTNYLTTKLYSLSANKSPLKRRVLDMPLDEALDDMRARGITVRMQTSNPELLRQWSLSNARQAIAYKDAWTRLKREGLIRFVPNQTTGQEWGPARPPGGMVPLEDRVATIFKSPFTDVEEARDASVIEGLGKVADGLGIDLSRKVNIDGPRSKAGGTVWGYSVQGGNKVVTKFAGDESILAHEIGHQIDDKFGLWNKLKDLEQSYKAQGYENWSLSKQLRDVTDLTWEGKKPEDVPTAFKQYVREKEEKMANLISAYVHAPDRLKAVAPDVFNVLDELVDTTPPLQGLREIEPGIRLTTATGQVHAGGAVMAGRYYADPTVARVMNNAISHGLGPAWDNVKGLNNALNQLQLGLSGFHFTGTAINAGISDVALGVRQLARGDLGTGAASVARGATIGASFARDLAEGKSLVDGLKANSPEAYAVLKEKLNPAGGRLNLDAPYRAQMVEQMRRAWANQNYLGAAWRAPFALMQTAAKPLMEYAIPRVKLGAFLDLARDIDERLTPEADKSRAYATAWDSIDNRFGQLVYDNLFWNKTARDVAHLSFRSVGWNLGTVRELGAGATTDLARALKGQGVSDRLLYTFTLPLYVGTMGAIYQYLHTGQGPQEMKDYFYPKNGRTEPNGMVSRTTMPTYMKDVQAYASHPLMTAWHKQSPLLELTRDLMTNESYFGDMIRNPDDSAGQQLAQVGRYALKNALPFSVQQFQRAGQETATPEGKAESFLGFVKAPASMERTPAETLMHDFLGPRPARTPEQVEQAGVRADLREAVKTGDKDTVRSLAPTVGKASLSRILRDSRLTGTQSQFKRLSLEQQLQVYTAASPSERAVFGPLFGNLSPRLANAPPEQVPALVQQLRQLGLVKPSLQGAPADPTGAVRQ
jgi:hypothetical protein